MSHSMSTEFNGGVTFGSCYKERGESDWDTSSTDEEDVENHSTISPAKAPLKDIFHRPLNPDARIGDLVRSAAFLSEKAIPEYAFLEQRDKTKATAAWNAARRLPSGSMEQRAQSGLQRQYIQRMVVYARQGASATVALNALEEVIAERQAKEEKDQLKFQKKDSIPLAGRHISPFQSFI